MFRGKLAVDRHTLEVHAPIGQDVDQRLELPRVELRVAERSERLARNAVVGAPDERKRTQLGERQQVEDLNLDLRQDARDDALADDAVHDPTANKSDAQ